MKLVTIHLRKAVFIAASLLILCNGSMALMVGLMATPKVNTIVSCNLAIDPISLTAHVENARLDWSRWGVPASVAWVTITEGNFTIGDTFTLPAIYHDRSLDHDLLGTVRVSAPNGPPTFTSDERQTYTVGGFTYNGRVRRAGKDLEVVESPGTEVVGTPGLAHGSFGWMAQPATCTVHKGGFLVATIQDRAIPFDPGRELLDVTEAAVTLHLGRVGKENRSLYHPSVDVYDDGKRFTATLKANQSIRANTGWWDAYSQTYTFAEMVVVDSHRVEMRTALDGKNDWVVIQSRDFFAKEVYWNQFKLMGGLPHAISAIDTFLNAHPEDGLPCTPEQVVRFQLREPGADLPTAISSMEGMMKKLEMAGMIDRDEQGRIAGVTDRFRAFANAGRKMGTVHDSLSIVCHGPHHGHVVFYRDRPEVEIYGANRFLLNKTTEVVPDSGTVMLLGKNRSLKIRGTIRSGQWLLQTKEADPPIEFDYSTRRLGFKGSILGLGAIEQGKALDRYQCNIEGGTGFIDVGHYNYLALKRRVGQPASVTLTAPGRVQFDSPGSLGATYGKDTFYYHVNPVTITRLDRRTMSHLKLAGQVVATGVMNPVSDTLRMIESDQGPVMAVQTEVRQFSLYGGGATVTQGRLTASHAHGLQVDGRVQMQAAQVDGRIHLGKRSIDAPHAQFSLNPGNGARPAIAVRDASIHYSLDSNEISLKSNSGDQIQVYTNAALRCLGQIKIRPDAVHLEGELQWGDALSVEAPDLALGVDAVTGKTSYVRLRNATGEALVCRNMTMTLNPNTGDTRLISPDDQNNVALKQAGFWADFKEVRLTIAEGMVTLASPGSKGSVGNTAKRLVFEASKMQLQRESGAIQAEGVKLIHVGDATVMPYEGKIDIGASGSFQPMTGAVLTIGEHQLEEAGVSIQDTFTYSANGRFPYHHHDGKITELQMQVVCMEGRSFGTAPIEPDRHLMLSKRVEFNGKAHLNPGMPRLQWVGTALLHSGHPAMNGKALTIQAYASADSVTLQLPPELLGQSGLYQNTLTGQLTVAILRPPRNTETILVPAGGLLSETATGWKISGPDCKSTLEIDENAQRLLLKGQKTALPLPEGAPIRISATGDWNTDFAGTQSSALLDLEISMEDLPDPAWRSFVKAMNENPGEVVPTDDLPLSYPKKMLLHGVQVRWDGASKSHVVCGTADLVGANNAKIGQRVEVSMQWMAGASHKGREAFYLAVSPSNSEQPELGPLLWLEHKAGNSTIFSNVAGVMSGLETKRIVFAPMPDGESRYQQWRAEFEQKFR